MSEEREGFKKGNPEDVRRGKTDMMVGDERGKVFVRYPQPVEVVVMDPQNAFTIAEAMARAAHKAKFGKEPESDHSYIAQQIRSRITDEIRERKINRCAILLNNMQTNPKTPGYWAMQIVDSLLNDL